MRRSVLLLSLLISVTAAAQTPAAVDRLVAEMMRQWQIPGAAVAIVQDDRVVVAKGYGVRELGKPEPVTADTLFQLASTTKAFTTTAMAILADEKKLTWDDPVRQHLDYFRLSDPCVESMTTLRDVVTHRIGLERHDELWDNTTLTREEVVRRMGTAAMVRGFRAGYGYHNIMYITAGEVVGSASGTSWDDFVRTRIFTPLGMTRTVITDAEWSAAEHATGYRWFADGRGLAVQPPIDTTTIGSGGAIKSTARDMAQWLRFQLGDGSFEGRRILSAEALAETKKPHVVLGVNPDTSPETNLAAYALGWSVQDYRGELVVEHTGSLNGFRARVVLLPNRKTGFVLMINAGRAYAIGALRNSLIDLALAKPARDWNAHYLAADKKSDDRDAKARQERDTKRVRDTTPSHALDAYAGTYESKSHGAATISVEGGALVLLWERMRVPLQHWHYDTFLAESEEDWLDERLTFATSTDGTVKTLTIWGVTFTRKSA
jgi:CubicO group peptidase (beta-lactamase class C family)